MTIAFTTEHGSHLYGLSHAGSDDDFMIVYTDGRQAKHKMTDERDAIHVGIYDFLEKAQSGSHQFLEAMFSRKKIWEDDSFRPLVENYVIPSAQVREKYMRTIHRFCFDNFKRRRHAVRLKLNLDELTQYGRFNPTLDEGQVKYATEIATHLQDEDLWKYLNS